MPFVATVRRGSKRHAMPFVERTPEVRSLVRREVPEIRHRSGGDTNRLAGTAVPSRGAACASETRRRHAPPPHARGGGRECPRRAVL